LVVICRCHCRQEARKGPAEVLQHHARAGGVGREGDLCVCVY
jgi:hypothetical protein